MFHKPKKKAVTRVLKGPEQATPPRTKELFTLNVYLEPASNFAQAFEFEPVLGPSASQPEGETGSTDLAHYQALLLSSEQALEVQPEVYQSWYDRGDALANLGNCEAALDSFDQALVLKPDSAEALVFRGVMLIRLERYEAALDSCEQALAIAPKNREAWIFRGVALRYLGRYKQAYSSYDRALGIQRPSIWQRLAGFWRKNEKPSSC